MCAIAVAPYRGLVSHCLCFPRASALGHILSPLTGLTPTAAHRPRGWHRGGIHLVLHVVIHADDRRLARAALLLIPAATVSLQATGLYFNCWPLAVN